MDALCKNIPLFRSVIITIAKQTLQFNSYIQMYRLKSHHLKKPSSSIDISSILSHLIILWNRWRHLHHFPNQLFFRYLDDLNILSLCRTVDLLFFLSGLTNSVKHGHREESRNETTSKWRSTSINEVSISVLNPERQEDTTEVKIPPPLCLINRRHHTSHHIISSSHIVYLIRKSRACPFFLTQLLLLCRRHHVVLIVAASHHRKTRKEMKVQEENPFCSCNSTLRSQSHTNRV